MNDDYDIQPNIILPMIRKVMPAMMASLASDIIGVQPMSAASLGPTRKYFLAGEEMVNGEVWVNLRCNVEVTAWIIETFRTVEYLIVVTGQWSEITIKKDAMTIFLLKWQT